MRIGALLWRWIETLATLFLAWQERRREQRALTLAFDGQDVVVRDFRWAENGAHRDQSGQVNAAELMHMARDSFVVFEFPAERIVTRQISVPAQAEKFLSGVISNQIERLSPWSLSDVVYGFDTKAGSDNAAALDVRITMASRTDIEAARRDLAARGLDVDRIVARDPEAPGEGEAVTLWSRLTEASGDRLQAASRKIGIGLGATVAVTLCLSLWALGSAELIGQESEAVAARLKVLQRQVGGQALSASTPPAERAWVSKETSISSVILIEAVSRALPDSAYLNEIRLEGPILRLTGSASDAPGLLAPLEQSGHLTGVHFFAPTTRSPDGKSFRFSIEAHVEPRIKVAGD
jgi:general secretion pathway protein L